ncbi:hypothetical protein [Paenibacillus sp. Leaf72]|uniref:hypothetical protein n=1 Tax=Paenibacillus sp. Leaf72 TaxID=1736234 RepID=UPI0006FBAE59|nr:hypothetical protein [Paenibacillus sp. Leaf72]KQN97155.1 hypothetical protein ASF12_24175 [Paenibacillus sp. Leaf72]
MIVNTTLNSDFEFDNAIFMGYFVIVFNQDKMVGWGLIESFNELEVQVNGKAYLRKQSIFKQTPVPDVYYELK